MKKSDHQYYRILAMTILVAVAGAAWAQPKLSGADFKALIEKAVLVTDREIYCVGEEILLSTFNTSSAQLREAAWSNVLYVELIDAKGTPVVQKKYAYSANGAEGEFDIPNWVLTGNYYLRAYTRWMRNYSPSNYTYKMVRIINPYRSELLENYSGQSVDTTGLFENTGIASAIRIKAERNGYAKRDKINLEVSKNDIDDFQGKLVMSVVRKGAEIRKIFQAKNTENSPSTSGFIPETRGVSISGKIVNLADSLPLASTLVGLTVFDESPGNLNILTNDKGRFYFDLNNRKGESEIFISTKPNSENITPVILVDNDFSAQKTALPFVPLDFSPSSKALYQFIALNTQILSRYTEQKDTVKHQKQASSSDTFYGDPEFVIHLDEYINMPAVKDYFSELTYKVRVKQIGNKHILKVINNLGQLESYDPLILMDMVSIFDVEKILELKPDKLDRIEVITAPYIRGNITYGGIISFFSKKHDLAGIDLPSAGRFISYQMLAEESTVPVRTSDNPRIPDLSNCLYWNPDLEIKNGEIKNLSFSAGDNSGEYLIVVQGVDKFGHLKVFTQEIRIE